MTLRGVLFRVATITLGYCVAVTVAVIVTVALIVGPTALPDEGAYGSLYGNLDTLPGMLVIGWFWTFPCALPGFVVAVLLGEHAGWNRWTAYALAGAANAVPSLAIFHVFVGPAFEVPGMAIGSFPGGFAGGSAYWLSTARFMARDRSASPR